MNILKGTIVGFSGSWMSGLGALIIREDKGRLHNVPCDNGTTVRSLDAAFDGFISENHCVDNNAICGKEIYWSYDEMGLCLEGFTPVEEASDELLEAYELQLEEEELGCLQEG